MADLNRKTARRTWVAVGLAFLFCVLLITLWATGHFLVAVFLSLCGMAFGLQILERIRLGRKPPY